MKISRVNEISEKIYGGNMGIYYLNLSKTYFVNSIEMPQDLPLVMLFWSDWK